VCTSSSPSIPKPPPPPVDESALEAKRRERGLAAGRRGLLSTVATSPQGLLSPASTEKKSLLGGAY